MILLCIHRAPPFSRIQNPAITPAIRKGHELLCIWAANPGVAHSLRHVELNMVDCGLLSSMSASVYRAPGGADGGAPGLGPMATAVLAQAQLARSRMELDVVMEGGDGV